MKHVGDGVLTEDEAEELWHKLIRKFLSERNYNIWAVFAKEDSRYIGHARIFAQDLTIKEDWEVRLYF